MSLHRVCKLSDVGDSPVAFRVPPLEDDIVVFWSGGEVHALEGHCPHQYYPFELGADVQPEFRDGSGAQLLVCPLHGWRFDLKTGKNPDSPMLCLAVYPVTIQDGEVWIEIAAEPQ
jgi:nitrite reductase/ring-hydroxylating ferredoxin subunit